MTFRVEYSLKVSDSGFTVDPGASDLLSFITEAFLLSSVCVMGILGNLLTILVLGRKEMKSTVNCLLRGLALCDIVFLVSQGIAFGVYNLCKFFDACHKYRFHYDPLFTPVVNWSSVSSQTGSIYFTLAITIERFIVVYYPLHAKRICSWKRARTVSAIIILFSLLFGLPHYFGISVAPVSRGGANNTTGGYMPYVYAYTTFGKQSFYKNYIAWGQTVFQFILPFIGLVVLNSLIAIRIRRAEEARSTYTASQRAEVSVSKMLLCVVVVFGICYSLLLVDSTVSIFIAWKDINPNDSKQAKYLFFLRSRMWCVLELLCAVNSASNFIVYCLMGPRFRASLTQMCTEFREYLRCCSCSTLNQCNHSNLQSSASSATDTSKTCLRLSTKSRSRDDKEKM